MAPIRFLTVDPGHFHAALVQREMYPQVDPRVHVYAPLGPDLLAHLQRISGFNTRPDSPARWELEVHACHDFLPRLLKEKPGNVVVLAGRNQRKIDYILQALNAGMHVLADKPWIIDRQELPRLAAALDTAEQRGLVAFDIMTERFEITSILQRDLVQDAGVFGTPLRGTPEEPAVYMESVHFLKKTVAGAPLRRPAWFFDIHQQGEALTDVGPHLVDLAMWILFPGQAMDQQRDIRLERAERWPTAVTREDFQQVTGDKDFADFLQPFVKGNALDYYCNTRVAYSLRGIHIKLDVLWGWEAAPGAGDTHLASFRGSKSCIEIRQGPEEKFRPELYVIPNSPAEVAGVRASLQALASAWAKIYPGVGLRDLAGKIHITIPESFREGHEAHFAQVTRQFLRYVQKEDVLPAWEKPNMLAKYHVTTEGVALSRETARAAGRIS